MKTQIFASASWISTAHPEAEAHLTPRVADILELVAAESRDTHARIYTQAEMIRAIEMAMALPRHPQPPPA